jgi:hypothetical protein
MKTKLITTIMIMFFALMLTMPVMAAKPTQVALSYKRTHYRWWGDGGISFGSWSSPAPWYNNQPDAKVLTLAGNMLKTAFIFSVPTTGASTVYVYDKVSGLWILHEGTINYSSPNSGLPITEYWRGFLEFNDIPSTASFVHGVNYRRAYVYGLDEATVIASYPYAVWDAKMGAWLVEFDILLWDPTSYTQSYAISFPSPFIEPVPANNYNPLNL